LYRGFVAEEADAAALYLTDFVREAREGVVDSGERLENRKAKEPPAAAFLAECARAAVLGADRLIVVPWFRAGSGYSRLFYALSGHRVNRDFPNVTMTG
jgi:hypothetical protein